MNLYEQVTNQIIELMETATSSQELWSKIGSTDLFAPKNHVTGDFYNGINILILAAAMQKFGYQHNEWLTFNQAKANNLKVRKGEKSTVCVFYKPIEKDTVNPESGEVEKERFAIAKPFYLFNVAQLENVTISNNETSLENEFSKIEAGEIILNNLIEKKGAAIQIGSSDSAYYVPSVDKIVLPAKEQFTKAEYFYSVLVHEASHWTGNKSRLDRNLSGRFGSQSYAMEELIAELSSAFTCAKTGIVKHTIENHACYLKSWLQVLKNDTKAIFTAAAQAQKAHEFIMN